MTEERQEADLGIDDEETPETAESSFLRYQAAGGKSIDDKKYKIIFEKFKQPSAPDEYAVKHAEAMAARAGIELQSSKDSHDPRVVLFGILRAETGLTDQRAFAEALRMSGDTELLKTFIEKNPEIFGH